MRRALALALTGLVLAASPAFAHTGKDSKRAHRVDHRRDKVYRVAKNHLGVPYVWGGTSWGGYDCSGFTTLVYRHGLGISLPRTSLAQAQTAGRPGWKRVWRVQDLRRGDLVFYAGTYRAGISHVGVAMNRNYTAMAHGFGSRSSSVAWSSYYRAHFAFGIRPAALRTQR